MPNQAALADLSHYPNLTVVLLGLKVRRLRGLRTLLRLGGPISALSRERPEGLLHHETFLWRLDQVGIRQYWRDFDALERFSRSEPHRRWWRDFSRDAGGTGFWHEVYQRGGGMEGIYLNLEQPPGFGQFAPTVRRSGATDSARQRLLRRAAG